MLGRIAFATAIAAISICPLYAAEAQQPTKGRVLVVLSTGPKISPLRQAVA